MVLDPEYEKLLVAGIVRDVAVLVRANYLADKVKTAFDKKNTESLILKNRQPDDTKKLWDAARL